MNFGYFFLGEKRFHVIEMGKRIGKAGIRKRNNTTVAFREIGSPFSLNLITAFSVTPATTPIYKQNRNAYRKNITRPFFFLILV